MYVNTGKLRVAEALESYHEGLYWALFTSNTTISAATVLADLTEAAWTGYARVQVGELGAAAIVAGKAQKVPDDVPVFENGSGAPVSYYCWGLIDTSGTPALVAAANVGETEIAAGAQEALTGVLRFDNLAA